MKHNSVISDIWFYIRLFRKNEPLVLVLGGAEIVLGAFLPFFMIYLPKVAIDLVERRAPAGPALIFIGGFGNI